MKGERLYLKSQVLLNKIYSATDNALKAQLYSEYFTLLRKSAYLGFPEAQFELGLQYEEVYIFGNNINNSESKCMFWYDKACINGVSDACNNLAIMYESKGFIDKAIASYKRAIDLGDKKALRNFKKMKLNS